jgi:hypothetical protein
MPGVTGQEAAEPRFCRPGRFPAAGPLNRRCEQFCQKVASIFKFMEFYSKKAFTFQENTLSLWSVIKGGYV